MGVGRKKSCSVDTTFGSVDTRVCIAKKCGYQGPQTAAVVIFLKWHTNAPMELKPPKTKGKNLSFIDMVKKR